MRTSLGRLGVVPWAGGVRDFGSGGRQVGKQAGAGWEAGRPIARETEYGGPGVWWSGRCWVGVCSRGGRTGRQAGQTCGWGENQEYQGIRILHWFTRCLDLWRPGLPLLMPGEGCLREMTGWAGGKGP